MRPSVPTGFCDGVEAEDADRAGLGLEHAEDVLDERGLAGAVAADEAEDAAAGDGERDVVERLRGAELAGEPADVDRPAASRRDKFGTWR